MGNSDSNIRSVIELICGLILLSLVLGIFLVAAFLVSPYMLLGMGFIFLLELYRRLKYNT